jgi:hypothetical protein
LNHAGFAYRYHARDDTGVYEPFDSPRAALDHVIDCQQRDASRIVAQWAIPSPPTRPGRSLTL